MLRPLLCLSLYALVAACHAQATFSYSPSGPAAFSFDADSVWRTRGAVTFSAVTVVRIESFSFLGSDGIVFGERNGDPGAIPGQVAGRSDASGPHLSIYFYVPSQAEELELPWRPKLIRAITAN